MTANESSSGYGIEELSNLDLKSRFSLFERGGKSIDEQPTREGDTGRSVKRSDSILSRLMRFDTDAAHRASQNLDLIDSSEEEGDSYDMDTIGNRRSLIRGDDSVSFGSISSIKSKWKSWLVSARKKYRYCALASATAANCDSKRPTSRLSWRARTKTETALASCTTPTRSDS